MPCNLSCSTIADYWAGRIDDIFLNVMWEDAHERCWRCGEKRKLEKCHIVPESLCGLNDPSNVILLCTQCHRDAPNIDDPRFMWIWLQSEPRSGHLFWTMRGLEEFERMFGRRFLSSVSISSKEECDSLLESAKQLLAEMYKKVIVHYGEGRLNPATTACVLAQIEEQVSGKPILTSRHLTREQIPDSFNSIAEFGFVMPSMDPESSDSKSSGGSETEESQSSRLSRTQRQFELDQFGNIRKVR